MRLRISILLAAIAAATTVRSSRAEPSSPAWLDRVNFYRAAASLPPVEEAPALSAGVALHARYMVMHDVIAHTEKPRRAWATREGAEAARVSNLAASTSAYAPDTWAVDTWMQSPFHAIGILDPALRVVGFGIHHEYRGRIRTAAALDVINGRAASDAPAIAYPIVWPSDGSIVPLTDGLAEYPNPLASCRGFRAPTGLPLIVQLGSGSGEARVTQTMFDDGVRQLEHCVFDETTYRSGSRTQQRLGRQILAARDAIVLIPKKPLTRGSRYHARIDVDGRKIEWTFAVTKTLTTEDTENSEGF